MFTHILIATDGSELSNKALDGGFELARLAKARVTLYRAVIEYLPMSEFAVDVPATLLTELELNVAQSLEQATRRPSATGLSVATRHSVEFSPYHGIIECAKTEGCDLILMSSHGRSGLSNLILGSETQKVLAHSNIPVLVYR